MFGSGSAAQTVAVTDPSAFAHWSDWIPIAIGAAIAFVVHLAKATIRPAANVATAGVAAPLLSTLEDIVSIVLVAVALVVPLLAVVIVAMLIWAAVRTVRARREPSSRP
ncbi:MAG: hypothetical protein QOH60_3679 [Mycobacterium sp.]|nr:hypothetical protein [Mycobacterium sp.]